MDGHSSHYDPDSIRFARDHSVIIFCLPPHTTHEAQPLDVSFFGPLKKNWSRVCHDFIQSSPGKAITKFNFSELFSRAWLKICLPAVICSGFAKAGIIPFDPECLLKRCPGTEGAVEIRQKKSDCKSGEKQSTEDECQPNSSGSPALSLPPEKEELFERRFDEGYDIYDAEYVSWLHIHHPDADTSSFIDFFPDTPALTPVDGNTPNDAHQLSSSPSSGYQPSNNSSSPDAAPLTSSSSGGVTPDNGSLILAPETFSSNGSTPLIFSSPTTAIPPTPHCRGVPRKR